MLKIEPDQPIIVENRPSNKRILAPVIFETYNEVTFFEPTEWFHEILKKNSYENHRMKYDKSRADIAAPGGVGGNIGHHGGTTSLNSA